MPLRPLILAIALAFGTPMTACAQPQTATGYAMPADGTLLSVSAEASAKRVPDVATISTGVVTQAADANAAMRANAVQPNAGQSSADTKTRAPPATRGPRRCEAARCPR